MWGDDKGEGMGKRGREERGLKIETQMERTKDGPRNLPDWVGLSREGLLTQHFLIG